MSEGDSDALANVVFLNAQNGRGEPVAIREGLVVYAWSERGILDATIQGADELRAVQPNAVALHSGTADLLANLPRAVNNVRAALPPDTRIWVGLGIDGTIAAWRAGKLTAEQVVTRYAAVAKVVEAVGAEVLVLNGEGKWALSRGDVRSRDDVRALAAALGLAMRQAAPSVVLALSSFGALGFHADIRALIEGLTPHCSLFTGQSYAARPGPVVKGVLPKILERDERSQAATVRQEWMRDDEGGETDDPHDDLDRVPSVQAHKTDRVDLAAALCRYPIVLVWAIPTIGEGGRADAAGLEAMRVAQEVRRYTRPDSVRLFQRANGLRADGVLGPQTYARALARAS